MRTSGPSRSSGRLAAVLALVLTVGVCCAHPLFAEALHTAQSSATTAATDVDSARSNTVSSTPPFAVFGYLPEYRQLRFDYEAVFRCGLTHLIFFSSEVDPTSLQLTHVDDRLPSREKWKAIRELANTYGVKLLMCIGGGGRSAGFPRLVADVLARRRFINEVSRVLQDRELDGVDFNWEYPSSMTEWLSFGQFLTELRSALDDASAGGLGHRNRLRPALITMALHPHPSIPHVLHASRVLPSLDYLHWMAYDHIVANDSHSSVAYAASVLQDDMIGGLDGAMYRARREKNRRRVHGVAEASAAAAAGDSTAVSRGSHELDHRRKLCLGIPFYGRHREDMRVPPESYEHLWQFLRQWALKHHPDWVEGGPELRALSSYAGYGYNGYDDVKRKMRLARSSGIGGIMIWELGQDVPPGTSPMSLMAAVREQLADWREGTASTAAGSNEQLLTARQDHSRKNTATSPQLSATPRRRIENTTGLLAKDDAEADL
ncbi:Chitinase [Leptomonas seymouri]|uniref:Chitinase n=1 Tax=Leptomonas seymouri TaxID=5684 RepID=A0A0N0P753_LEPSE|nr:Chitinase [Leptomonas seymouri]|eukprot:KPI87927.1 Chitinase [Leptomonas seymouri]